ncbi:hypothetical protein MG293_013177 [Ovis ammon polii]|uniref:Uncharacterized protein n=1 Tax=Ovis ammon polii TaxID=230172 RepID=A0AAD4U347_OVIAM|nr:hypothetical protein MG293_013177 [Ovis ammon polii]
MGNNSTGILVTYTLEMEKSIGKCLFSLFVGTQQHSSGLVLKVALSSDKFTIQKKLSKLLSQGFPWQKKATFLLEGYASLTLQNLPHLSETYVLPQYESEATLQSIVGKCPNRLETTFCYGTIGNDDDNLLLWELLATAFGK